MALVTTTQSAWYMLSGPASGAGNLDVLNCVLTGLCARGNPKDEAALVLRRHVEEQVRDLSVEAFFRFMDRLYDRITSLLESNNVTENLGALRAIDELIDIAIEENAIKFSTIATYMRTAFEAKREPETLALASKVLGHLARAGGAMTTDEVERLVKIALDWLRGDRIEYRRFAAVLILKEMAENASTVFNMQVSEFVDAIWVALRDPKLDIRVRAVEALRACLRVIEKRETRWRVQWYYCMFEAAQDGLRRNAPIYCIHGSLLAIGELLRNTGEFMMSRYREVAEIVLKYVEHRDRLVRLSITSLLPRIAHFLRDRFVANYLAICMKHILHVLKIPAEAASGFIALGEMAGALDGDLTNYLPTITSHLHDAIAPRRGRPSMEALACVGNLAIAVGPSMEPHVQSLLDTMLSIGLSSTLVEALENITASIPTLLPTIQVRLLDCISGVLSRHQQVQSNSSNALTLISSKAAALQVSELSGPALVQLALQTLAHFNFKDRDLLEFVRESVVPYLEDDDGGTRRGAALCSCKLMAKSLFGGIFSVQFTSNRTTRSVRRRRCLVAEILDKLLIAAVSDTDLMVRQSIFSSLHETGGFDDYLAQADCLTVVFAALNDEDFTVREIAISLAGRLSEKNPAYVLPTLRRHLIQLLTYLKQSADSKCREESVKLLGCLIRNCERLILTYISPIHKALITELNEGTGASVNNGIISGVLVTVGDLARVGGFAMRQYIPELMPLIVEVLFDSGAATKRVAITTLGQVVQSTGYVITPYNQYPQLLGLLLKLLNGELAWSTRHEVLKVLGILGALDPHKHRSNQLSLPGSHGKVAGLACDHGQCTRSMDEVPMDPWPSFRTSEDFYSTVAISLLMRIFRDPSLSIYHQKVVGSLIFIFKAMNLGCVAFLPKVLPELIHTVRTCDDNNLKEYITWKLGTLVSIVHQHIRKYLPELFSLISELWSSFNLPATDRPVRGYPVLHLLEQLCLAFNDEFKRHLPFILPFCIQVLSDAERFKDYTYVVDILHTLEVFGGTLDEHMHLLLPALIRIFMLDASVEVRRAAIRTLTKLIPHVQMKRHISALVHNLKIVLDGDNDDLRKDAVDALCCLAQAFGNDFTIFLPSIHKLLLKHHMPHNFEEIEDHIRRRRPLILGCAAQKQTRIPGEVISDPLNDTEDPECKSDPDKPHKVNEGRICAAAEASQRSTREDWVEWMRHFSIELLKESSVPALRTCAKLSQLQPFVGRELFTAGFVSCWTELNEPCRRRLVRSLEMAFSSPNIPHEILATLLNLAEFMEHDGRPLPIDIRLLGALAEKCRAFAKALHYKEMEFEGAWSNRMDGNPVAVVETLIHINNQLHQHEAAVGILTYAQQHLGVQLKESWYEKLQRWDDALKAYTVKGSQVSSHFIMEATLGRMRCLAALARWEELNNLCKEYWTHAKRDAKLEMAPMAASAAWNMGEWDQMAEYVSRLDDGDENKLGVLGNTATGDGSSNGTFFRAILLVHRGRYDEAREYIERARKCSATEVAALVLESYERAYTNMVRVQQLSELEEVIDYCTLPAGNPVAEGRRALIRNMWSERIRGAKRNIEVWQAFLSVRSLVLPPTEDAATWIKFASLCRKSGRISQARSTLIKLLQFNPESTPETVQYHGDPQVILAYLKYQWSLGDDHKCKEALARLKDLAMDLSRMPGFQQSTQSGILDSSSVPFVAHVYLKLGTWQWALSPGLNEDSIQEILNAFRNATHCAANWAKAWHKWALFNTAVMSHYTRRGCPSIAGQFVVAGVTGYFNSIAYGAHVKGVDDSLQDILRLLTLWFNHGASSEVQLALERGFSLVNINTWLVVLPQIIARIHSGNRAVRELTQTLLVRIGQSHPQALMYPLLVACNSSCNLRKHAAQEVVDKVRQHSGVLVAEAQLVSTELIRVSVLWQEMWHGALEEASRLYFGERNAIGMLNSLEPLQRVLEEGAMRNNNTANEQAFLQQFHQELMEAYICSTEYRRTGESKQLTQAWDCYYSVFKRLNKQLPALNTLELQSVSPELLHCCHLKLAVPGTYKPDSHVVTIASFSPQLVVITSKQRPRKLTINGSDGEEYAFLLKGNEDLRQDERVMQLFGLVNTLLENSRKTAEKDLSIQRYAVIPLSRNSGLREWVPNCDTLHSLIQEYRDARKIDLNQEHRLMLGSTTNYDHLPVISKVEAFEYALKNTKGNDLLRVLWLKSPTSEIWLERRTNYTRSLAVMSMVGYLLGLGDRHPSNLMLHRYSGKILHIDFGDCFEASMNRDKFPEKVPFRLTRMLIKAMEVGGIEGNFRSICESVMQVLRTNKDSVMAMMEAFVHDPLINWRLVNFNGVPSRTNAPSLNGKDPSPSTEMLQPQRAVREKELLQAVNQLDDANEVLNERAVTVMARMSEKLTGQDFSSSPSASVQSYLDQLNGLIPGDTQDAENGLSVKDQVQKLILQATSHENLCQNYFGWCPFW